MVCPKCGAQIGSGDSFCSKCGTAVDAQPNMQGSQNSGANWKKYLNRDTLEYLIAAVGLFPLAVIIVGGLLGVLGRIYIIGLIFKVVKAVFIAAVIIVTLGACGGIAYMMTTDRSLLSPPGYMAAGVVGVSLVSIIIAAASSRFNPVAFVLAVAALIAGLDVISRVFLQKKELASSIEPGRDVDILVSFIKKMIEELKQQKAARDEENRQKAMQEQEYQQRAAQDGSPVQLMKENTASASAPASYFDGGGIELLGYIILSGLLGAVTFSIAVPWTTCMVLRWRKSHTVINGRRLTFTGTGGQMLLLWLKWFFLSLITLGIYAFFAYVDFLKWEARHTFFDDQHPAAGAENPESSFDGNTAEFIGYSVLGGLISTVTLGIGFPWAYAMMMDWQMKHYVVSGYRMKFDGSGLQFLGTCIICILLCAITFGIYSPWMIIKLNKWLYSHTHTEVPMTPAGYAPPPPGMELFNNM